MTYKNVVIFDNNMPLNMLVAHYVEHAPRFIRFKPNTVVLEGPDMKPFFEINSSGFKGPELNTDKKLIAIWGASVVAGVGRGWVDDIATFFPGTQFVNGAVPRNKFGNIFNFATEMNQLFDFQHNIIMARDLEVNAATFKDELILLCSRIPNPVLCTVATPVGDELSRIDLRPYRIDPDPTQDVMTRANTEFRIDDEFTGERNLASKQRINEQNAMIREVAQKLKLPLIDLYQEYANNDPEMMSVHFSDCTHFRPSAYPHLQKFMAKELSNVI